MERVTLTKTDLLTQVRKNREAHETLFKQAIDGYRKKVADTLGTMKKLADENKDINTHDLYALQKPESHVKEYDRVINMLNRHTKDEVELSNQDFGRYYEDDWDWKERWIASNSHYTALAR